MTMMLLTETLNNLRVKTIDEAIPLIEWADVDWDCADGGCTGVTLPPNHTDEQCRAFLNTLAFNYNSGYGCQEVYGTIMLKMADGWSVRNMMVVNGGVSNVSLSIIHDTNRAVAHGGVESPPRNKLSTILIHKNMTTTKTSKRPRIKGGRGERICMVTPQREVIAFSAASTKEVYKRVLRIKQW